MKDYIIKKIEEEKIIAVVRGVNPTQCRQVADALYAGGIRLMEFTYDQNNPASFQATADAIKEVGMAYEGRMMVGAGTVTTTELVDLTAKAGGKYIISPDVNVDVIRRTVELGMVSIPGAMTPTEIMTAHHAGADFVKLFPVSDLGVSYVKAIRAPISHVKLLAVGGVNEENIPSLMKTGICGVGVGGNLANKAWIEAGEFDKITDTAKAMIAAVNDAGTN